MKTDASAIARNTGEPEVTEPDVHLIVFRLGKEEYGIRIEQVKEVTITPEIAKMPRTPAFIKGVANIRGDIVAIMDLEERFGLMPMQLPGKRTERTYTLVIERENYTIGIVVPEVPQSFTLAQSRIDKTPAILQDAGLRENYIEGIGKLEGRLIIILDIYKILTAEEEKLLTQRQ